MRDWVVYSGDRSFGFSGDSLKISNGILEFYLNGELACAVCSWDRVELVGGYSDDHSS